MKKNNPAGIQGIIKRVMLLIKNRFLYNSFDAKIVLILPSTIHPIRCHCGSGNINIGCHLKGTFKRERLVTDSTQTSQNDFALARLAFYDDMLIGQETNFRCPH